MEPLKQFYCDECNEIIRSVEDGWFEWLCGNENPIYGFRIVHNCGSSKCFYPDSMNDSCLPLSFVTGIDGLSLLLTFLKTRNLKDYREVVEIIFRLHIPHYEEARKHFDNAVREGIIDNYDLNQKDLVTIIKHYTP